MQAIIGGVRDAGGSLRRGWGVFLVGVVVLGTAQATIVSAYVMVDAAILRPFPYPQSENLIRVVQVDRSTRRSLPVVPLAMFRQLEEDSAPARLGAFHLTGAEVRLSSSHESVIAAHLSSGMLTLLGATPLLGREFSRYDEVSGGALMLAGWWWRQMFDGDPSVVGSTVIVDGSPATIVGVTPDHFVLPIGTAKPAVYLVETLEDRGVRPVDSHPVQIVGRLDDRRVIPVLLARFEARVSEQLDELSTRSNAPHGLQIVSQNAMGQPAGAVVVFAVAASLQLLLAATIVAFLFAARELRRRHELYLKCALGASRTRLALAVVVEVCLLAAVATLVGWAAGRWVISAIGPDVQLALGLSRPVAFGRLAGAWMIATCLMAIGLVSLAPLLTVATAPERNPQQGLGRVQAGGRSAPWKALVGVQLTMATIMVIVGAVSSERFIQLSGAEHGFDPEGVIAINATFGTVEPDDAALIFESLEARLEALPSVQAVAMADLVPFIGLPGGSVRIGQRDGWEGVAIRRVSPRYFDVLRIPLLAGRTLSESDMALQPGVALVNDALVRRYWPDVDPLGMTISEARGAPLTVVGVVGSTRDVALDQAPLPTVYIPLSDRSQVRFRSHAFLIRGKESPAVLEKESSAVFDAYRLQATVSRPISLETLAGRSLKTPRLYAAIGGTFTWIALVLAFGGCLSVFGQFAARSRRDAAIRVALGATRLDICGHFGRHALLPIALGLSAGLVAGALVTVQVRAFARADLMLAGLVLVTGLVVLVSLTAVAVLVPAYSVARVDPVTVLRQD